ncbi:MAG TPA: HAMP domain-containing sensor histidine kinase [Candidatus Dormibacteraeota bacterium]|nr:HAMP domain-containing sensor histidine kinase [Candidatus Dormibacteraeota bacterium]
MRIPSLASGALARSPISAGSGQSDARRLATAVFVSRVRWVFLPLGLVEAFAATPPPLNRALFVLTFGYLALYNSAITLHRWLPAGLVQPLIAVAMASDVVVAAVVMVEFAHVPTDSGWAALMLVGPTAAVLYGWRGVYWFGPALIAALVWLYVVGGFFGKPDGALAFMQKALEILAVTVIVATLVTQSGRARERAESEKLHAEAERHSAEAERRSAEASRNLAIEAREQLAAANEVLKRVNRLEEEGLSNASHEFRNALIGIQGYSELLLDEKVTPEAVHDYAAEIQNEALRLNRLITNMLDLDRLESHRATLSLSLTDLNRILRSAADRGATASATHTFALDLDGTLHAFMADSDRLTQVAANLVSNAVKYSPGGSQVRIASRLTDGMVRVSVTDQGHGIRPGDLARVFSRFERIATEKVAGTGLGMPISKEIIELHHGKMWVESTFGVGSTFFFELPVNGGSESPPTPVLEPARVG